MLTTLSIGWGVQSFTLAAMSALGTLPKLDFAVFSDTNNEKSATYRFMEKWMPWLENHGVWVACVEADEPNDYINKFGYIEIPAFGVHSDDNSPWVLRRHCTAKWKVEPIRRFLQEQRVDQPVEMWMGISIDEFERAKTSNVKYITHRYPLLEMDYSREDCVEWLLSHDLEVPPRSACVFCPYTYLDDWKTLEKEDPADFAAAVAVDEQIRHAQDGNTIYLNRFHIPLVEIGEFQYTPKYALNEECDSGYCFM